MQGGILPSPPDTRVGHRANLDTDLGREEAARPGTSGLAHPKDPRPLWCGEHVLIPRVK
jgi:hypothetical protein